MPSKKQRRRRQKERRHEYEYVYVDSEGHDVEVEEEGQAAKPANGKTPAQKPLRTGRGRTIEPPSWRRTFRRAALFAPFMLVILYLLRPKGGSAVAVVVNVLVLMAFFVPFSFFMDSMMYRVAQRRLARGSGSSPKGSSR